MHRETLTLKEKVLVLREKVSGKEHPSTLTVMHNLAHTLSYQGKYAEAEKMHRETLALREKVLGKEHPDTLTSMNAVAREVRRGREGVPRDVGTKREGDGKGTSS